MIGFLRGKLAAKSAPSLILEVSGVGYELDAPMSTFYDLPSVGEELLLHTHLVVREDAHILFGFSSETDRALFRTLIKVNGVGARMALTILSGFSATEFHQCIEAADSAALVRLPGVGKKTAERLLIEMRDRLPSLEKPPTESIHPSTPTHKPIAGNALSEATSALVSLGYKPAEASRMVRNTSHEGLRSEEIIRQALQSINR